jgi:hypothetical protein
LIAKFVIEQRLVGKEMQREMVSEEMEGIGELDQAVKAHHDRRVKAARADLVDLRVEGRILVANPDHTDVWKVTVERYQAFDEAMGREFLLSQDKPGRR